MTTYDYWFLGIVAHYRPLGFFVSPPFAGLSEVQCQRFIEQKYPNWFAEQFLQPGKTGHSLVSLEQSIVQMDRSRVWFTDQEGVYRGSAFYAESIKALAAISQEALRPEDVSETWEEVADSESEFVIHVRFEHARSPVHLWLYQRGDFAKGSWIDVVNEVCGYRGPRFRLYRDSQDWRVVFQSDADAAAMAARGWTSQVSDAISGILCYPPKDDSVLPASRDRWLYWYRGMFRYRKGDIDGAWEDWLVAQKLGFPDLYRRCDDFTQEQGRC